MDLSKFNKKTKIERAAEKRKETDRKSKISLSPRTGIEHDINEIAKNVSSKWRGRTVNEALNLYKQIRSLRHDVWVEMFDNSNLHKLRAGDINVREFCNMIKRTLQVDILLPERELNKTPDMLFYISEHKYVLIGDISVSVSEKMADSRKYIKYNTIAKAIEQSGLRVRHMNLIIRETHDNVESSLDRFISAGILENRIDVFKRAKEYSIVCQKLMADIPTTCKERKLFMELLDKSDKMEQETEIPFEIHPSISQTDLTVVQPKVTEDEVISWVVKETEKLVKLNYFDNNPNDIEDSINKLIYKNKDKEYMEPKATLKVVDNSNEIEIKANYELLRSYLDDIRFKSEDDEIAEYVMDMLPNHIQINRMEEIYNSKELIKDKAKNKKMKVYGPYQYDRFDRSNNLLTSNLNEKLQFGLKNRNKKTLPKTINPDDYNNSHSTIENMINYYGSNSNKYDFLDDSWDCKTNFERENTSECKEIYEFVKKTNGAQFCHTLSNLYHRITHLKTALGAKDNVYIPPNGSFICIIPKNHAPITTKNCDLPFIFITRFTNDYLNNNVPPQEYEYSFKTEKYTYYISKLCRYNLDKISNWDQAGFKLVATATYILNECKALLSNRSRVVGILTLLIIDSHQKTSEYLELMKYIAYMPFSDVHKLSDLIEDKMDLLIKTSLDIWLLLEIKDFMLELTKTDKMDAKKPKLQLFNTNVTRESLGLAATLPSFMVKGVRHSSIVNFIEEVQLIFTVRPKQLYGSQFMDRSIDSTVGWNIEYEEEISKYGDWAVNGQGEGEYPFDAKFCYSSDAIYYAYLNYENTIPTNKNRVMRKMASTKFDKYMHTNCSLRGCVKSSDRRKNNEDYHTTSMEECLYQYQKHKYDENECSVIGMASRHVLSDRRPEFAQSEKEQRGPGRPISTPDIYTKAGLIAVEKPEQSIGHFAENNIIVPGKNKLKAQCEAYKSLLSSGSSNHYKFVFQLTEDQSKFSENDNTRKYKNYIKMNNYLDPSVRALQLMVINKIEDREHLVHRIPASIKVDSKKREYINSTGNGIKVKIGWPQGMLNFISTSIHSMADYWITHAFNKAYPEEKIITNGLVHSDDSWLTIACNSLETFKKFCIFRMNAKRLFCLKLNIKKIWGSKYLGELVSNYNVNGNVHLSISKMVSNCFANLTYQNWVMDVNAQISAIQQAFRSGAKIDTLTMMSTILRQQIMTSYNVNGRQLELIHSLPIELGGYPDTSPFELGLTGLKSYYHNLITITKNNKVSDSSLIMLRALRLSLKRNVEIETTGDHGSELIRAYSCRTDLIGSYLKKDSKNEITNYSDIDYDSIIVPGRGEIFSCISHIMPKSRKVARTINSIKNIPFDSNGMEMIITNPKSLKDSLGNLKSQTSTLLYNLAADKYTSSAKRLAISQAIQSSGKVVRLGKLNPMTMNEMLELLLKSDNIIPNSPEMLETAFTDETDISTLARSAVYSSDYSLINDDKRKIINRQPETNSKFKTVARLDHVLMFIVDSKLHTKYLDLYAVNPEPMDVLIQDSEIIMRRFSSTFSFYNVKLACNLIMQQYIQADKSRLWMQPYIRTESLTTFVEDLYGKTINKDVNYSVNINFSNASCEGIESDLISTMYTLETLNKLYDGKFKISKLDGRSPGSILRTLDYGKLNNDMYLKYGILCNIHLNTDHHLHEYDRRKPYDQKYEVEQKMIGGKYVGEFKCYVKYGKTTMIISGFEKNVSITSNTNDINEILFGMMMFVNKNFPYYTYNHPNSWHNCEFYQSQNLFSKLYITSYSANTTIISSSKTHTSIPFTLNKKIMMKDTYNEQKADKFAFDEYLKTVYKYVNGDRIKVSHVKQSLHCPRINDVVLVDDIVDGLSNQMLIKDKTIIYITTHRYFNCNKKTIYDLMESRMMPYNPKVLLNMWVNMIDKFSTEELTIFPINEDDDCETVSMDIGGQFAYEVLEEGLITSPEDLSSIDVNYTFDSEDRIGAIYKHKHLSRALGKILIGNMHRADIEDIIYLLMKDPVFAELFRNDLTLSLDMWNEKYNMLLDIIGEFNISPQVYSLITSAKLHETEIWEEIDIVTILSRDGPLSNNKLIYRYKELLKCSLMDIIYDKSCNKVNDSLLDIAKNAKKLKNK